jgi:hypothetical protein
LEVDPALARLLSRGSHFGCEIVSRESSDESSSDPFDFQVPLLSLPLALGLFEPLPMTGAYVHADPLLRSEWRERLGPSDALRVGLVWAGSSAHKGDRLRSMPSEALRPLLKMPGFQWYSLQVGPPDPRVEPLADAGLIDLTEHLHDFADTAAFVAELDLVLSVDTAVAHIAGAMGCPVWTLLSYQGEWRWGVAGESTAWYPTMRLFRQPRIGDWGGVMQRVASELALTLNHPR